MKFFESVKAQLADVGLGRATLQRASSEDQAFGNASVVFRLDELLIRIVRDRGQVFLELAAASAPTEFYQYGDVEIAFGWKTVDQVLAKGEPDGLGAVLIRLSERLAELGGSFSGDRLELTRVRVELAARERGKSFTDRLRRRK